MSNRRHYQSSVCFHGSPEAVAAMASEPNTQSRVMFQATDKTEEPAHRKLGKLTVKYNRKDLQRRLDIEEWIDGQLHLLFDCEEEEIPELEIDIDELLELTDEGQRGRLHELLQECGKPKELGHPLGHVEDLILGMPLPPQFLHGLLQQTGLLNLQLLDRILVLLQILIQYSSHPFVKIVHTTIGICCSQLEELEMVEADPAELPDGPPSPLKKALAGWELS
ncbi:hypothetical protein INR49_014258, partial [Caranx melampygus]